MFKLSTENEVREAFNAAISALDPCEEDLIRHYVLKEAGGKLKPELIRRWNIDKSAFNSILDDAFMHLTRNLAEHGLHSFADCLPMFDTSSEVSVPLQNSSRVFSVVQTPTAKQTMERNPKTKHWKVTFPQGHSEIVNNLAKFCRAQCLDVDAMVRIADRPGVTYKGFAISRVREPKAVSSAGG